MITKKEFSAVDANPTVLYGKEDRDSDRGVPIVATSSGSLMISKGLDIPPHDYVALTYVSSGNGEGEIETVTFKQGGSSGVTVAILTLEYDSESRVSAVSRT